MRFMINKKYIDSTKRYLEELGYYFSAFSAHNEGGSDSRH